MAIDHDAVELVLNHALNFDCFEWLVVLAFVRASHICIDVLLAHHVVAAFSRTAHRLFQQIKAETAFECIPGYCHVLKCDLVYLHRCALTDVLC